MFKVLIMLVQMSVGFPGGSAGKEPTCNAEDLGSIPGLRRSPREGKGYPLQYCGLENSTTVHGVTKSRIQLSKFHLYSTILQNLLSSSQNCLPNKFEGIKNNVEFP